MQAAVCQLASAGCFCQIEKIIVKNKGSKVKWNNASDRHAWLQVKFLHNIFVSVFVFSLEVLTQESKISCLLLRLSCNCYLILTTLE